MNTRRGSGGVHKSINKGVPALVCVPTGEILNIDGKMYTVLKLTYDLKGEYVPKAMLTPQIN